MKKMVEGTDYVTSHDYNSFNKAITIDGRPVNYTGACLIVNPTEHDDLNSNMLNIRKRIVLTDLDLARDCPDLSHEEIRTMFELNSFSRFFGLRFKMLTRTKV